MNSSGIKRGLAVSAVSALALTGLAIAPAQAQTVAQGETALELYSQYSGGASTRNDGANTTVTLFAGTPATIGGTTVNAVRFQYQSVAAGGAWVDIETVVAVDGVATTQWTPPANPADVVGVRAEALSNAGAVLATDTEAAVTVSGTAQAADLAGALRSEVGIGPDDEIVVRGTTTDSAANTVVNTLGPVAAGAAGTTTVGTPNANNVSNFVSVVPVGANDTADATDEIIVGVEVTGSDDVNAYTAYDQVVTAANMTPSSATVQAGGANNVSTYTVTVTDQKGQPVQGLDIYESNAAGAADASANGGTVDNNGAYVAGAAWETDVDGKFVGSLQEADIDNADDQDGNTSNNSQTAYFVADVNQNGAYDSGVDYRFQVTQAEYATTATTIEVTSAKGTAIDDDESTQVTLLVKDQNGNPIQGVTPVVRVTAVNNDLAANDPAKTTTTTPAVGATGADGKTSFTLTGLNGAYVDYTVDAYVNNNGTPQPDAGDAIATPVKVVSHTSKVIWDSGTAAQAAAGTTKLLTGKLVQDTTETVLPGRTIAIDYAATGNSILAAQAQQPAGTTRGSNTTASATTDASGAFGVAVTDPATPAGQELGSDVTAQAPALESAGDATDAVIELDFLRSLTPTRVEVINPTTGTQADGLDPTYGAGADLRPGSLPTGVVRAYNADNVQLEDVDVAVTIDEGFFVNPRDMFDNPTVGGLAFDFKSAGKSITVSTGDTGNGTFWANIERHEGFDDDGLVDDTITATVGGQTDTHDLEWDTNNTPLNPRSENPLVVELSEEQDSTILPKARAGHTQFNPAPGMGGDGSGQVVNYDVQTFDQFGNPTSQSLSVSDNTPLAAVDGNDSEFALNQPALQAFANGATSQSIEVELNGQTQSTYTDNPANSEFDPANPDALIKTVPVNVEESTEAIDWYELDFDASTFTLDQQGSDTVKVGSAVTEVLTATDQEGQPIDGLGIGFLRVGPSEDGDTDGNASDVTNDEGKAFYDFAGNKKGAASVTAVVYSDEGVRQFTVGPDVITFVGTDKVDPNAKLTGKNNGGKADRLKVKADAAAAGAQVQLFRIKNGNRVLIKTASLNDNGVKRFKVADKNGKKATKYLAIVAKTSATVADKARTKVK